MLGGRNNFEVDWRATEVVLKGFPSYPRWAKLNRWFLQLVGEQWAAQGQQRILDLGDIYIPSCRMRKFCIRTMTQWLWPMHEADYVDNTEFNGLLFEYAGS